MFNKNNVIFILILILLFITFINVFNYKEDFIQFGNLDDIDGQQGPAGKVGPAGQDGKDGQRGERGADGEPGPTPGPDGFIKVEGLPGEKGDRGSKGDAGVDGVAGQAGATGAAGPPGEAGQGSQGSGQSISIDNLIQKNMILAWSGSIGEIPSGWALCDGTNGTPNLSGRFILGAGEQKDENLSTMRKHEGSTENATNRQVDDIGGWEEHKLSEGEMPSHNHDYRNSFKKPGHGGGGQGENYESLVHWRPQSMSPNHGAGSDGNAKGHTTSDGGDQAHNNMPPYYVLAFIMKTSNTEALNAAIQSSQLCIGNTCLNKEDISKISLEDDNYKMISDGKGYCGDNSYIQYYDSNPPKTIDNRYPGITSQECAYGCLKQSNCYHSWYDSNQNACAFYDNQKPCLQSHRERDDERPINFKKIEK